MNDKQDTVIADLRHPLESRNPHDQDKWSQWRSLPLIELSALDTYHFVKTMLPSPKQKILEIGCGNGYLSLELARDGHHVVGLDKSQEGIAIAERTKQVYPATAGFGELTYHCADIMNWPGAEGSFDIVIMNRTLHHLHPLQPVLTKVKYLLGERGTFLCQDYAYDRLQDQTASWLYSMQRLLFLSGLSDDNPATAIDEAQSLQAFQTTWFQKSDHRLNRYAEMMQAFQATFHEQRSSWVPYLFVLIGNSISHATAAQQQATLTFLRNMEQYLIEQGHIQAVGFRYVGTI